MATATPQAMPVGTILQMCDLSFYEVVRATAKTVWVQELRTKNRTPTGVWSATPIRGAYMNDTKLRCRCNPTDGFVKIGIYKCYVYTGFAW
jgi:hypothetical protein